MGILKDEIIGILFGRGDNILSNKFEKLLSEKNIAGFVKKFRE